ncbi:BTAD domain-containing putative transcriptional regulator [Streptosporangium sp. NPDC000396]|uniref:BTAD domain-containing putative transcriptional regulator n=1 Tax=Streptosporangium sp. NPDC000396 TaxID=3366185 RepID=UPI003696BB86
MLFAVLGPLEVRVDGQSVPLGGLKQRIVLAVLLRHANRPVSSHVLIDALWGGRPPRTAGDNLRLYVYQLRRALGTERISRRREGYELLVRPGELDAERFDELSRTALVVDDDLRTAEILREALALWRGRAYAGMDAVPLLGDEASRLEERRLAVLESRIEADFEAGPDTGLTGELLTLVAEHPLRERLRGQLMLALNQAGRQAEALAVYQDARRTLAAELGVDPGPELRRIHQAILAGSPERHPGSAQLPPDIPDFAGRDEHLGALVALLRHVGRATVVSVIAGMGGMGKTTLAVHAAHRVAATFVDGQLYANLQAAADPAQVLAGFLAALGLPGAAVPKSLEDRAALYRSRMAQRRMLIVLDNATSERQVRPLLPGSAGCAVLVTSRSRLSGLEGARLVDLGVLDPATAVELLAKIAGRPRVDTEPGAAVEIVRLCDHMPLAVRVAGARLAARPHWRLEWFAGQLRDERRRLDQLSTGDLAVRAGLALSYEGLPERARQVFRRLGLIEAADFAAWTVAALLDASVAEAEELVEELVDAQLLTMIGIDQTGAPRYRLHDLVRLYARERAELEDSRQAREIVVARAIAAWLALAEGAMEDVPGPCYAVLHGDFPRWRTPETGSPRDSLAWFDSEREALTAMVGQACALGLAEAAWDLAGCLERYFDVRGLFDEWRRTNERVMDVCREAGNLRGEAVMLRGLLDCTTWMDTGHAGGAMVSLHDQALRLVEMFQRIGERRGLSDAHAMCAWGLAAQGAVEEARKTAARALALAEETGHLGGQARAYLATAVALGEERLDAAIPPLLRCLDLARKMGNPRFEATALQFLGMVHGEFTAAHDYLTRSLAICRELRDPLPEAMALNELAKLYLRHADPRTPALAAEAESLARRYHLAHHLADALWVGGCLDLTEGRVEEAVTRLEESVRLWRTRSWPSFLSRALRSLGDAYAAAGRPAEAQEAWSEADTLAGAGLVRTSPPDVPEAPEPSRSGQHRAVHTSARPSVPLAAIPPESPVAMSSAAIPQSPMPLAAIPPAPMPLAVISPAALPQAAISPAAIPHAATSPAVLPQVTIP